MLSQGHKELPSIQSASIVLKFFLRIYDICLLKKLKRKIKSPEHFNHKAFFEAYFSNYIEGTVFEVKEAERIVFDNKIPSARPADAHDILSTYKIVSDPNAMRRLPRSAQDLEEILKSRHKFLFEERPDILPGSLRP